MPRSGKIYSDSDSDYSEATERKVKGVNGVSSSINKEDIGRLVNDVVLYCLVTDQRKALIKRADIVKCCNLNKSMSRLEIDTIMDQVGRHFRDTFGMRLQEKEDKKGVFMLVNSISENNAAGQNHLHWNESETAQMGLTFTILGLVFMSGGKISDETLFRFVMNLGLSGEDSTGRRKDTIGIEPEVSCLFEGDIKKFVNDTLVSKQHYLKRSRVLDVEGEQYEYAWGERARVEVKKSSILKFICEIYGCKPKMFTEQFNEVKQEEGEDALQSEEEEEEY